MKKFVLAAVLALAAGAASADPVSGIWKTEVDDGAYAHVKIGPCGNKICGTIARAFKGNAEIKTDNVGKRLVWDMVPDGKGGYSNGKVWQPSTGKTYRSKMSLNGNSLKVSGCVGPFCKKQTWSRVK